MRSTTLQAAIFDFGLCRQLFHIVKRKGILFNGEKGSQVSSVRGYNDQGEEVPDCRNDPGGQGSVGGD